MAGKSLGPKANEALRVLLRRIMNERFDGKQVDLADAMDIAQGHISEFLSGKRGAGSKIMLAMSRLDPEGTARAMGMAPTTIDTVGVTLDGRYPNRERAIDALIAAGEGTEEEVRRAMDAAGSALKSNEDLPLLEWVDMCRTWLRRLRRGEQLFPGSVDVDPDELKPKVFRPLLGKPRTEVKATGRRIAAQRKNVIKKRGT